ncbi:MAG: response regulator [bacterium]|nr:response regulator [bacterium]
MVIAKHGKHFFVMKKIIPVFIFLPALVLFMGSQKGYGASDALTFFANYSAQDYRLQPQNWDIRQDTRGIIYIANQGGLLEFDGVSWKDIDIPNATARSIAIAGDGVIYIGGKNEIGYLTPGVQVDKPGVQVDKPGVRADSPGVRADSPGVRPDVGIKGALIYTSLRHHLPAANFGPVWRTHAAKEGIYFWTSKFLFRWKPAVQQMKVWTARTVFTASFYCNGHFHIRQKKVGLMTINKGKLVLLPGGDTFAEENIYVMVPYDDERLLLGTREKGFFLYDGQTMTPFSSPVTDYLEKKQLYFGIRLSSGGFALATRLGGLVIMDAEGGLKKIINKASGLPGNNVRYVFQDRHGNLWLALDNGISKIEYPSPFSIYDNKRSNLPGIVLSVALHRQRLFAGTTSGLYSMTAAGKFLPVPGISGMCWALLPIGDSLLAATGQGVFQLSGNDPLRIMETAAFVAVRSRKDPNRIWVGTRWGLASLYLEAKSNRRLPERKFESIPGKIGTIIETEHGELWLGTGTGNAINVRFPIDGTIADPAVTRYGPGQGLPAGEVHVFFAAGHAVFATKKGLFRFEEKKRTFIPDPVFGKEFADGSRSVFRIAQDHTKNILLHSRRRNFLAKPRPDGTYKIIDTPFLRLPAAQVNAIYPDPGGDVIWFAGHKGLVRYDTKIKKNYRHDFPTLIRKVWLNERLAFDGCKYDTGNDSPFPVIDYNDGNLRFEFAAPFFENEPATRYQCLLEGYNDKWTAWNEETKKDYTNLAPGLYTFRVRARNVYGVLGREDGFQFKILPSWYATWWAYSIYVLGFLLLMFLIIKWRGRYLEKEKEELEKIVRERTKEIEEQKRQLEKQTALLAEQSKQLKEMDKVKSRFFANISHEFRTPITLIIGPLEQMLAVCPEHDREQKKKLKMMIRNCGRLLRLINQLLELSNFESGTMKLQSRARNIVDFLKGIVASFEMLSDQEELDLIFQADEQDITLYFDDRKMEDAISNLLVNAIKFTPAGGRITVGCTRDTTHKKDFPSGAVIISVSDTGPGIPGERLNGIFDRFYQSESTFEHYAKGFGIGLAITKELVELHHGTINAVSTEGQGAEFIIRLPLGNQHLESDEMISASGGPATRGGITLPGAQRAALPHPAWPGPWTPNGPTGSKWKPTLQGGHAPGVRADAPGVRADAPSVSTDGPAPLPYPVANTEPAELSPQKEKDEKDIILVVEDSTDMRTYIKDSLEPLYRVVEAVDGRDGIEKAGQIIPDLIVSDIMMPEVNGYELCRQLKSNRDTSHIPIILLTAKAAEANILEGLETGADDYVTKPFNTGILCARIKNLIEIRSRLRQNIDRAMPLQPVEMPVSDIDKEFLDDLLAVIDANISDPEFNVDQLSAKLYMGRTTLYRKIHALSGETAKEFLRSHRLKRAAELLQKKSGSVLEVSFQVGFSSSSYFAKCFKEKFHQLPSRYNKHSSH